MGNVVVGKQTIKVECEKIYCEYILDKLKFDFGGGEVAPETGSIWHLYYSDTSGADFTPRHAELSMAGRGMENDWIVLESEDFFDIYYYLAYQIDKLRFKFYFLFRSMKFIFGFAQKNSFYDGEVLTTYGKQGLVIEIDPKNDTAKLVRTDDTGTVLETQDLCKLSDLEGYISDLEVYRIKAMVTLTSINDVSICLNDKSFDIHLENVMHESTLSSVGFQLFPYVNEHFYSAIFPPKVEIL